MDKVKIDFNYYAMYLLSELRSAGDERQDDAAFINGRADEAAARFEQACLEGRNDSEAQELAMAVLLEGVQQNTDEP